MDRLMADLNHTTEDASSGSGSRRKREFRRYAESVLGIHAAGAAHVAASSTDVPLTAFAQLVALRLRAKRVIISLLDKSSQYILAEATPTLSLQRDADHEDGDAMFFGSTVLPRATDWTDETLKLARTARKRPESDGEDAVLCIPDLRDDPRYRKHQYVAAQPFIRSYIGVPLMTPSGYAIGTLAVLDDQTRMEGVTRAEARFLRDVAASVMSHLELSRVHIAHQRGSRLVRGLSRFMEGKDTVSTDPKGVNARHAASNQPPGASTGGREVSQRTHALAAGSNAERVGGTRADSPHHQRPQSSLRRNPIPEFEREPRQVSQTRSGVGKLHPEQAIASKRMPQPSAIELQESAISGDIGKAFQRAAKLIHQAMDMAGVLFLDASAGQFGSMRNGTASSRSSIGNPHTDSMSGTETTRSSGTEREPSPQHLKACRFLGAAYQVNVDGTTNVTHHDIPEKFYRSLQRRYPYGKMFNYDSEGHIPSSDDASESDIPVLPASTQGKAAEAIAKRKRYAQSDSARLLKLFPGIRSFAIMPMYDSQRARHLAGALIWSYDPTRLLTFQDDLNYLGAFCDVLMAEIGRIEYKAEAMSKTNFISSISHELRSPLHGILGAVEFLHDDTDDGDLESRSQLVQVIDICGRSLLDIINNLLDHASTSAPHRKRKSARSGRSRDSAKSSDPVHDLAILAEEVLDSALWHTPKPAARRTSGDQSAPTMANDQTLKVILDLDFSDLPNSGWNFRVNAGAFRRILQNVTNNAIKYTDNGGYFKLGIKMANGVPCGRSAMVEIDCTDSGRGMSQEFLENGLWEAFRQEDPHAAGTGLGLSLVRSLVEQMNGMVDVQSTKDVGTSIVIRLPLTPGSVKHPGFLETNDATHVDGLTFALIGFDSTDDQTARSAEATNVLRHSIEHMCQYLKLLPVSPGEILESGAGVFIVTERRAIAAADSDDGSRELFQSGRCIILCDSVFSSRTTSALIAKAMPQSQATVMPQPVGPRQLLRALTSCLGKTPIVPEPPAAESLPDVASLIVAKSTSSSNGTETGLPDAEGPITESQAGRLPCLRPPMSNMNSSVLLVDDNAVNLTILKRYMVRLGRQQSAATNGLEAIEMYKASQSRPHLPGQSDHCENPQLGSGASPTSAISIIFMDITMPIMDGLESTRCIRAYERSVGLKPAMIVALTALASPQARQEAYSSGVDLFLTKPVRFADIQQMFKDWEIDIAGP